MRHPVTLRRAGRDHRCPNCCGWTQRGHLIIRTTTTTTCEECQPQVPDHHNHHHKETP